MTKDLTSVKIYLEFYYGAKRESTSPGVIVLIVIHDD
jgi:hypothetical protein